MITRKFNTRVNKYIEEKTSLKKSLNFISTIRLILFIFILYLGYKYIKGNNNLFSILALVSIISFITLIIYYNKLKDKLNLAESLININNRYLDRISGLWLEFSDIGEDFIDKKHRYSSDLDIIGSGSLFQRINLSSTSIGRSSLAKDLINPDYNKEEILNRQKAIEELGSKLDFVQRLEYESKKNKKTKNPKDIISYFENTKDYSYPNNFKIFIKTLPIATLGVLFISLFIQIKALSILGLALLFTQIIFCVIGNRKNQEILNKIGLFKNELEVYLEILKLIEKESFKSAKLENLKNNLFSGEGSINAIKQLDMISERVHLQSSGVLYLVLNIFFLWDYRSAISLNNWKFKYTGKVKDWLSSIGELESLSSLSVLLQIEENISYPIIEDILDIKSKSCGHPLIKVEERICNNINIENNILVITGSNMSGKTTFLRTIGINLVLLNAGAVTISEEFISPIMDIYTSMRVTDDLTNKISTFYAELLRIKEILDFAENNRNTAFLIDEIFKGTNSKDRILGAKNVLKNLNNLGLIGAITTHDFELCELDVYPRIINYHFAEDYIDGKISFDYKIKQGKSESTNARYLMELVGIEIID